MEACKFDVYMVTDAHRFRNFVGMGQFCCFENSSVCFRLILAKNHCFSFGN